MCSIITKQTGFDYSATIKPSLLKEKSNAVYSFIQNKDFEGTNINLDTDFYIPVSVAEKYPNITIDTSSLLVSISGKIGNVGLYLLEEKAFIGGAVGICKLKDVSDGQIALYELLTPSGQEYFASLIKASSHANITVEDIRNIKVFIPKTIKEKIEINNYVRNIIKMIDAYNDRLKKLRNLKISFLNKMIPHTHTHTHTHTRIPQIRFKEFVGEWKCVDLCSVANVYQPQTIAQSDCIKDGLCPVYGANGIIGYSNNFNHKAEQICLACRGSNCGVLNISKPFSWINGNAMVINCDDNKNIIKDYLYYYLTTLNYDKITTGGAQPQITREPLLKLKVMLP